MHQRRDWAELVLMNFSEVCSLMYVRAASVSLSFFGSMLWFVFVQAPKSFGTITYDFAFQGLLGCGGVPQRNGGGQQTRIIVS